MNVQFYSFSKRRNSTKQPAGSGTVIDCKLKEGTSVKNPKLQIFGRTFGYNYAYIPDFGRYYFVNDIISESYDITTYVLEEDVLASNKTAIGNTVARIGFSSTGYNEYIPDSRIAVEKDISITAVSSVTNFNTTGCYVLTAFSGQNSASYGLGTAYVMTEGNMNAVHDFMGNPTTFQKLVNFFKGNPIDGIFGCIWVPFHYDNAPGTTSVNMYIGDQDSSSAGYSIASRVMTGTGLFHAPKYYLTIPRTYNDFRDYEPYTTAQLYLPGVGCIDINLSDFRDATNICIKCVMEYGTGDVTYFIGPDDTDSRIIQTITTNVASPCPLGQTTTNMGGVLGGAGGVVGGLGTIIGGIATENAGMVLAGAGAALVSSANMALQSNKRGTSLKGGSGGRSSSWYTSITLVVFVQDTENCKAANYIAQRGRPVAQTHAISNHSGYVQCDDASVSIAGDSWEREEINSYLNSGFFYE